MSTSGLGPFRKMLHIKSRTTTDEGVNVQRFPYEFGGGDFNRTMAAASESQPFRERGCKAQLYKGLSIFCSMVVSILTTLFFFGIRT